MKHPVKICIALLSIILLITVGFNSAHAQLKEDIIANEIRNQLSNSTAAGLYFPNTVKRFYQSKKFKPIWVKQQSGEGPAWQAMLLIDCVLQFGLSHADYHPKELLYDQLHDILDTPDKVSITKQAKFEIVLTDAIITFINHLHYGKLNPYFTRSKIDDGGVNNFNADVELNKAILAPDFMFMQEVIKVQPKSKEYQNLQYHTHLLTALYQGDCYDVPEDDVQLLAINMERLRWANIEDSTYIHVNIPSYTLMFHQPDTTYFFKVITGTPQTSTPTLQSTINYFDTAPDWNLPQRIFKNEMLPKALKNNNYFANNNLGIYDKKGKLITITPASLQQIQKSPNLYSAKQSPGCDNALGQIVFRFPNIYNIYLHDTPEKQLFDKKERDFSHGCIRVENPDKLAELLLINDSAKQKIGAMKKALLTNKKQSFILTNPVPIKITYLTCKVKEGELIKYKDIYGLDKALKMALYSSSDHR